MGPKQRNGWAFADQKTSSFSILRLIILAIMNRFSITTRMIRRVWINEEA